MIKAIKVLYIVNIVLFTVLIPLCILFVDYSIKSFTQGAAEQSEGAEVIAAVFATLFFAAFIVIIAFVFVIADVISLILAIIGLKKIMNASCKRDMKAIAITQIIFLGNIVPAIMSLAINENQFVSPKIEENTLNN